MSFPKNLRFSCRKAGVAALILFPLLTLSSCVLQFLWVPDGVTERIRDSGRQSIATGLVAPFKFLVVGDPHFGAFYAPSTSLLARFEALAAAGGYEFVVFVGDEADSGSEAEFDSFKRWADGLWKDQAHTLHMPWYALLGNHDFANGGWPRFLKTMNPGGSRYRIDAGGWSIYCLDTASGTAGEEQFAELSADFSNDPRPKIVMSHYAIRGSGELPYYRLNNPRERGRFLDLFGRSEVRLILAGHWHNLVHTSYGPFDEWLVESLAYVDGEGQSHCFAVNVNGVGAAVERLSF